MDKLQEWLKDKKNQPIVAGALILVLVVAVVVIYMTMSGGSSSDSSQQVLNNSNSASNPTPPASSMPPGMNSNRPPTSAPTNAAPGATGTSVAPNAKLAGATPAGKAGANPADKKVVKIASVLGRKDPFLPVNWTPPKPPPPREADRIQVPDTIDVMPRWIQRIGGAPPPGGDLQQPPRRMAGLLLNGRIYAIIESNGSSELVQPGDTLKDGLAIVERIDRDKIVLKTTVGEKRYIIVRMASASKQEVTPSTPTNTRPNVGPNPWGPGGPVGLPRGPGGGTRIM